MLWGIKGKKGIYIGTLLEQYSHCYSWFPKTRAIREQESVRFKHKYITNPGITPADAIIQVTRQLPNVLRGKITLPLVQNGINTLKQITNIF